MAVKRDARFSRDSVTAGAEAAGFPGTALGLTVSEVGQPKCRCVVVLEQMNLVWRMSRLAQPLFLHPPEVLHHCFVGFLALNVVQLLRGGDKPSLHLRLQSRAPADMKIRNKIATACIYLSHRV